MAVDVYDWVDDIGTVNKTVGIPYGGVLESSSDELLKGNGVTSKESPTMNLSGGVRISTDSGGKITVSEDKRGVLKITGGFDELNLTGRDKLLDYNYIKPSHYMNENKIFTRNDGKLEVFDIIDYYDLDFYSGNIIKYIVRCGKKPNESMLKDLKKALVYLETKIKNETK